MIMDLRPALDGRELAHPFGAGQFVRLRLIEGKEYATTDFA